MCEQIKVSVCCITYNHGKYIRDCLEGFVSQKTNFKYEVIVHDDASTDNTPEIIREYAEKYPKIIKPILQEENQYSQGVSIFDKYIFPMVNGEYVALCEGDDYWCDFEKLQKQVNVLEANHGLVACVHQTRSINCSTGEFGLVSKLNKNGVIDKKRIFSDYGPVYHTSSLLYRKNILENIPAFCRICKSVGDYPWGIYLALKGPIYFINDVMSVYRMFVEGSWSSRTGSNKSNIPLYVDLIKMLESADEYSNFEYHKYFEIPILNYEYKCWMEKPSLSILKNSRFYKLKMSRKLKLLVKILF